MEILVTSEPKIQQKFVKLPFVGKVEVKEGVFSIDASKWEDLSKSECGFKFIKASELGKKPKANKDSDAVNDAVNEESEVIFDKDTLSWMKAAEVKTIAQDLVDKGFISQAQLDECSNKIKVIDLILATVNPEPENDQQESDDNDSGNSNSGESQE
jgi:hypothetical protein